MALWGGRFSQGPADSVAALSRSVDFDWRLAPYDVLVNLAHLDQLESNGIVGVDVAAQIRAGLQQLGKEIESGDFSYNDADEDVHSAIERGLIAKVGAIGGSIRAGRSRNDLVVTDFKLYLIDHLLEVAGLVAALIDAINTQADLHKETIAPGFTHLQHAQPILFGHELAKHAHALLRDLDRIGDWLERNSISPFGAGALSGSGIQPFPEITADALGFTGVNGNSIDAVSDRDFAAEALFVLAMIGIHLSRIGEEFTLWSTSEFGWAVIDDAFSTGSSIMPQKKNPDIAELARGKSGRLIGNLTGLLAVLKGLPFAYNRDLQEDKEPLFDSIETLLVLLPAVVGMIETTTFIPATIEAGVLDGHSLATEVADFLARRGVPFSQAHEAAGACVKLCEEKSIQLHELSDADFASVHPLLSSEVRAQLTALGAINSRNSIPGTSLTSVINQLAELVSENNQSKRWIDNERKSFTSMMNL